MLQTNNWEGWGLQGFGWLLLLAILVIGIWLLIGYRNRRFEKRQGNDQSALEILKKRYAKGELSDEEFEKAKEKIKEH